jgi:hypothetical protein
MATFDDRAEYTPSLAMLLSVLIIAQIGADRYELLHTFGELISTTTTDESVSSVDEQRGSV